VKKLDNERKYESQKERTKTGQERNSEIPQGTQKLLLHSERNL